MPRGLGADQLPGYARSLSVPTPIVLLYSSAQLADPEPGYLLTPAGRELLALLEAERGHWDDHEHDYSPELEAEG